MPTLSGAHVRALNLPGKMLLALALVVQVASADYFETSTPANWRQRWAAGPCLVAAAAGPCADLGFALHDGTSQRCASTTAHKLDLATCGAICDTTPSCDGFQSVICATARRNVPSLT